MAIDSDLGTGRASLGRVLDFAWGIGAFTATEAMTAAALTRSTTIEAIDTLVDIGVLRELPNARDAGQYRAGRPSRRFEMPNDLGIVVGIDSGDAHLIIRAADLSGETLVQTEAPLSPSDTSDERRDALTQLLTRTLADPRINQLPVLSLCAGVAAPVTKAGDSPPHPEGFWERTNPGFAELLAKFALTVEIKNDAQLTASAESASGDAIGCRNYIALLAGHRLGAGVVVDGHLLHGAHGGVGEMLAFDYVRGVDSAFGLGPSLVASAHELIGAAGVAEPDSLASLAELDAEAVLRRAAAGDPLALAAAQQVGERLALIVGVLGNMYDPERIIVCGAIAEGVEPVLVAAREALAPRLHLPAPMIMRSQLGGDVVVHGAVARALQRARDTALPRLAEERLHAQR